MTYCPILERIFRGRIVEYVMGFGFLQNHSIFDLNYLINEYFIGWGGFLKGLEISNTGINNMTDTLHYYIYENQRWNPITGFSTASLPTDRHLWSDVSIKD